eukprot:jgi/Bigna1/128478/aug1.6_g3186
MMGGWNMNFRFLFTVIWISLASGGEATLVTSQVQGSNATVADLRPSHSTGGVGKENAIHSALQDLSSLESKIAADRLNWLSPKFKSVARYFTKSQKAEHSNEKKSNTSELTSLGKEKLSIQKIESIISEKDFFGSLPELPPSIFIQVDDTFPGGRKEGEPLNAEKDPGNVIKLPHQDNNMAVANNDANTASSFSVDSDERGGGIRERGALDDVHST